MTDILFVNAMMELAIRYEVNGTLLLGTKLLEAGYDVSVLRFCEIESFEADYNKFIDDITDEIISRAPKAVSFYSLWPDYHACLRIAREVKAKAPEIIVVLGGPQPSLTAQDTMEIADYIDYICTGEGEDTVVAFFDAILKTGTSVTAVPGVYYRDSGEIKRSEGENPICDLNTLPHWDDRLYTYLYKEPEYNLKSANYFMPIDAGRGCPYSCTFCCTSQFWRRTYRLKSAERIIEDIRFFNEKYGITSFWFTHDAFTTNQKLVSDVCDKMLESGLKITWKCTTRIDCISEELILKMKSAGLTQIELGVETGSPDMQKRIKKNLDLSKARDKIAFLLKNDIKIGLFFMYGFPDETEEELNDTLKLELDLLDMGVEHVSMSFCRFNPVTQITEEYFDKLIMAPEMKWLSRGIFGYDEEFEIIESNKAIFPFYYHLDTPVRRDYHYLAYLMHIYQELPNSAKYVRELYAGDSLKFYKDFYNNNIEYFDDTHILAKAIREKPVELLESTIKNIDIPWKEQLLALLKFDFNVQKVAKSREDIEIRETYDFSYLEYKLKVPLCKYSKGKTEILHTKRDGKIDMKIISVK